MTIENIYKTIGVRRLNHFTAPRVINAKAFAFPKGSVLVTFMDKLFPKSDADFLLKTKRPILYSVDRYNGQLYDAKLQHRDVKSVITKHKKEDDGFNYVFSKTKAVFARDTDLVVFNYSLLNYIYKYKTIQGEDYKRTLNLFRTVSTDLNNGLVSDRVRYVHIPITMPIQELKIFISNIKKNIKINEKSFKTEFERFVFEMFKLLHGGPESSVFDKVIHTDQYGDIYFIMTYGSKLSLVSLRHIVSACKWSTEISEMSKRDGKLIAKMFLLYILLIVKSEPNVNVDKGLNNPKAIKVIEETDTGDFKLTDKDVESMLSSEIERTVEQVSDTNDLIDKLIEVNSKQTERLISGANEESPEDTYTRALSEFEDMGILNEKNRKKLEEALKDSRYTQETVTDDELYIKEEETKLKDRITVTDKTMLTDSITPFMQKYLKTVYSKDVRNTLFAIQNLGVVISDYEVTDDISAMGNYRTHTLNLKLPNGKSKKMSIVLPIFNEKDGTFIHSTKQYVLKKQKTDRPIRKISSDKVTLTSYATKIFITKARVKSIDRGFKIYSELKKLAADENSKVRLVIYSEQRVLEKELPMDYSLFSRYILSFNVGKLYFNFDYDNRKGLLENQTDLHKLEKNGKVLVGVGGNSDYLLMTKDGSIESTKNGHLGNLYTLTSLDTSKLPVEFAMVKIRGAEMPVGLILIYIYGLMPLLRMLGVKTDKAQSTKRFESVPYDTYELKFNDYKLRIRTGENPTGDMVLGGISRMKELGSIPLSALESRNDIENFMFQLGYRRDIVNEILLLDKMFIDPITKDILKLMKEPVTYRGLLVRACNLLTTDFMNHPNNIDNMLIKQHDRVVGMAYKVMFEQLRNFYNGLGTFNNTLNVNRYEVINKLTEDSTTMLVEDNNPVQMLKLFEDVTMTGEFGRTKETIVGGDREMHVSEVGIISEGVKDSGDVGISAYLSAAPKLENVRGMATVEDIENLNPVNILSTSSVLTPYNDRDDTKRQNFTGVQYGHVVPMRHSVVVPVSTGYDTVLSDRVPTKFVGKASKDGIVKSVDKDSVVVLYADKTTETFSLKPWSSKEEAGSTYIHYMVPAVRKNDRVSERDVITYDSLFFEPDIFDSRVLVFKTGMIVRVAFKEVEETFEDSGAISEKMQERLSTDITAVKSIVTNASNRLINIKPKTSRVSYHDELLTIIEQQDEADIPYELSDKTKAILENNRNASPKAEKDGRVVMVKCYYNCEYGEMSSSVRKLVKTIEDEYGSCKVNNGYSVNGTKLLPGEIEIKYYIEGGLSAGVGDKFVLNNQLKFTLSTVFPNKIVSKDGRPIDLKFSTKSKDNRIVTSADIIAVKTTAIITLQERMLEAYFN
jgi:hypothetical protein